MGHEVADELAREGDVAADAVVLVRHVRRPVWGRVVLSRVDLHITRVLLPHDPAQPTEDLLAGLLPHDDIVEVRRLRGAHLEMADVVVDARPVRDEFAREMQVRFPQQVERHHVGVEPHRAHLATIERVLVLGPLDHLAHASPDHRVRTGPEDLPLALLVDVHLRELVLLALLVDRHVEVLHRAAFLLPLRLLELADPLHEVLLRGRHDGLDDRAGDDVLPLHGLDRLFRLGVELDLDPLVLPVEFVEDKAPQRVDRLLVPSIRLVEALRGRQVLVQVDPEDLFRGPPVRTRDLDDLVEPTGPQEGGVHEVRAVRRADHEDVVQLDESVHLAQDLRDDVLVDAGGVHHPADGEQGLALVEEDDARLLLVRLAKDLLDDALALPDPLREDLRDADVEEGHVVLRRDRLHEQRLAATRRAVEQDPAWRLEGDLREQLRLLIREHDDVLDPLDRLHEPADLAVRHVRLLAEEEGLDLEVREDVEDLHRRRQDADLESGLELLEDVLVAIDQPLLHVPFHGDHELAVQHVDDLRDHALVAHRAAFHDRVRLRVHPDVLADAELRLVDQAGRDLEQFGRARDDNLVPVEVGTFLADDVRVEERRLLDLVELVLVGFQAVLPFLDLVAEGVKVALVLPMEAIHLLLELVSDFFRRLRHLSVALVTRPFWITAGLRTRVVQDATASALGPRVCGTSCRLVPSLV